MDGDNEPITNDKLFGEGRETKVVIHPQIFFDAGYLKALSDIARGAAFGIAVSIALIAAWRILHESD